MSIRDGVIWYYRNYGAGGLLGKSANRLFGRPGEISAKAPGMRKPVYLRPNTTDETTYNEIFLRGGYAFTVPFSPKIIVDAGANIGLAAIYFTHQYPGAKVIAIEPEASNFAILAKNVRPYPSIVPVHAALWNRDGAISVGEPDPATGASGHWSFVCREGPGTSVRALTMQTLMQELGISAIDLAKIDIEGAEQELFQDTRWLQGVGCVMIELHDRFRPGCSAVVEPAMQDFERSEHGETTVYIRHPQRAPLFP